MFNDPVWLSPLASDSVLSSLLDALPPVTSRFLPSFPIDNCPLHRHQRHWSLSFPELNALHQRRTGALATAAEGVRHEPVHASLSDSALNSAGIIGFKFPRSPLLHKVSSKNQSLPLSAVSTPSPMIPVANVGTALVEDTTDSVSTGLKSPDLNLDVKSALRFKRKRVTFADDKGQTLVSVRQMDEHQDLPPEIPSRVLERLGYYQDKSALGEPSAPTHRWRLCFAQPAAQYRTFWDRLQTGLVSLANAMIEESENELSGSVQVKNISMEKQVFLRVTRNQWSSFEDIGTNYVATDDPSPRFDTFAFKLDLSNSSADDRIDFAVCFRSTGGSEAWDNNDGKNYSLVQEHRELATESRAAASPYTSDCKPNFDHFMSLTDYRAWSHFDSETSYY